MWTETYQNAGMQKPRRPAPQYRPVLTEQAGETLFLREWLAALGLAQGKVADAAEVNTGYVSQLVNREKWPDEDPKVRTVRRLGDAMGVPWHLLYEMPPPDPVPMADLHRYPPDLLTRLSAAKARKSG